MGEMMHFPDTVEEFMELFKVIDSNHVYSNGIEFVPIFRMQQWFEHLKAQPKTEGDKIRAMSDEELADELLEWFACFMAVEWSRDMILDLLKQEVET